MTPVATNESARPSPKRIIIVEHDADLRANIAKYLDLDGYLVRGVGSAIECYKKICVDRFSLAIIDIDLPDQSGFILSDYLRKNMDMRIVMLTGRISVDYRVACYQAGADLYLPKPIDFRELSVSVSNLMHRIEPPVRSNPGDEVFSFVGDVDDGNQWVLDKSKWVLYAPTGDVCRLTSKEYSLLVLLASASEGLATRRDILNALDYRNDEYGHKALEAMIRRFRRKTEFSTGISPIKTFHGYGYCFSVPLSIR